MKNSNFYAPRTQIRPIGIYTINHEFLDALFGNRKVKHLRYGWVRTHKHCFKCCVTQMNFHGENKSANVCGNQICR